MSWKWYQGGLHFQCSSCGACCTGPAPPESVVWVTMREVKRIAQFLGKSVQNVLVNTVKVGRRRSLANAPGQDHCVFYDPVTRHCQIHEAKPAQCKSFPFWPANIKSRRAWNQAASACEGIGQGPLIQVEEITRRLRETPRGLEAQILAATPTDSATRGTGTAS